MNLKHLLLLGIAVILPKPEMPWEGMIARCDKAIQPSECLGDNDALPKCVEARKQTRNCHWECEYGIKTQEVIKNGVQTVEAVGCNEKPDTNTHWITVPVDTHVGRGEINL